MKTHLDDGLTRFHKHLDHCDQCRLHPFDLCWQGKILLQAVAEAENRQPVNQSTSRKENG